MVAKGTDIESIHIRTIPSLPFYLIDISLVIDLHIVGSQKRGRSSKAAINYRLTLRPWAVSNIYASICLQIQYNDHDTFVQ